MLPFGGPQKDLQCRVMESLEALHIWLSGNNLIFYSITDKNINTEIISLKEFEIRESSSIRFLGLTMDSRSSWDSHIYSYAVS